MTNSEYPLNGEPTMKRAIRFLILTCLAFSLVPSSGWGDEILVSTALTATGTYGCPAGTSGPCDLNGYYKVSVQVTCVSGPCAGEVDLQQRNTPTDNFATTLSFINPGTNDQGFTNTGYGQIQFSVPAWTSGTGRITLIRLK